MQILILDHLFKNNFICKGETTKPVKLFLHLRKNYFDVVKSLTSFFCKSYYCTTCLKPYQRRGTHRCGTHCNVCKRPNCEIMVDTMSCRDCHMECRSLECFNHHKKTHTYKKSKFDAQTSIPWESFWKCTICKHTLTVSKRKPTEHRCTEYQCQMCEEFVMLNHKCYMRSIEVKNKTFKYIHFDFTQYDIISCKDGYMPSTCIECNRAECGQLSAEGQSQDCDFGFTPRCLRCNTTYCGRQGPYLYAPKPPVHNV